MTKRKPKARPTRTRAKVPPKKPRPARKPARRPMPLKSFRRKWKGRSISRHSSSRTPQCIDLAREWIENLTGDPRKGLPPVPAAKDMFGAASSRVWRKVRYRKGLKPPVGAIVIFGGSRWGHVAIARGGSSKARLLTFDQNYSQRGRITDEVHSYDKVIGWLIKR